MVIVKTIKIEETKMAAIIPILIIEPTVQVDQDKD